MAEPAAPGAAGATVLPAAKSGAPAGKWQKARRLAALVLAIAISVALFANRQNAEQMAAYGYPAVFLVSLLGNATLVFPAPAMGIVALAATTLNPLWVGVVAGLGAAAGEMTGYLAGLSGQGIVENRRLFEKVQSWMEKWGAWITFGLAAVPNPVFDIGGIVAGMMRVPSWKFFLACWAGKSTRFILLGLSVTIWVHSPIGVAPYFS
jgi:membrane protein YqaA with SNARE-associated domain